MTTINTSDDLLRLLREDSAFYQEARRLILTDELIELPATFAAHAKRVDKFIEEQTAINKRVDKFIEEQTATTKRMGDDIAGLTQTTKRMGDDIAGLTQTTKRMGDDIAEIRGDRTYRICQESADDIAEAFGFIVIDIISGKRLRDLFRSNPPPKFTVGDRKSFYYADLIMEVRDDNGNDAYLAVEASYTGDERDTNRALRNAEYLRHITGLPAHAAVASRHNDHRIDHLVTDKTVLWYEVPAEAYQPR